MTTIATDGKYLAGDGRGTARSIIRSDVECKVYRLGDGTLAGFSGSASDARAYILAIDEGREPPESTDEFSVLFLSPAGRISIHYGNGIPDEVTAPAAIGTGAELALGAMLAGARPQEAVEIACRRDPFSGGRITALRL